MLASALYVVLSRLLELILLIGRGDRANELEILVLRHELSILRRQVGQPRFEPHDRMLLAARAGRFRADVGTSLSCGRRRSCAGIAGWSPAAGPTRTVAPGDQRLGVRCAS